MTLGLRFRSIPLTSLVLALPLSVACGSSEAPHDSSNTGGTSAGAASGTGGAPDSATGGAFGTGGGQETATGGQAATGGQGATGGAPLSTGGSTTGGQAGTGAASAGGTTSTGGDSGDPPGTTPLSVYIAGDSTVSDYADSPGPGDMAGWGQMFAEHYSDLVTVDNHAIGGRTARRFIDEGRLDAIWDLIAPGDYLLVQFGTNDGHQTATYELDGQQIPYYLDPATDFKEYLQVYIDGAEEREVQLVLVTPPPRNSAYCTGGNGTGAHAQAMRELAADAGVPLADLNEKTVSHLMAICPAPTPEDFFFVRNDGSIDGTHFQENGARIMSRFVADGIKEADLLLQYYEAE